MSGPIMAIFDICPFLTAPGLFEYFSENGFSENERYLDNGVPINSFGLR